MTYRSPANLPVSDPAPAGEDRVSVCELAADGLSLIETSFYSQHAYIQSFAAECDINAIVARAAYDPSILQRVQGVFADVIGAPTTLAEAADVLQSARARYDALPDDVKSDVPTFADWCAIVTDPAKLRDYNNAHKEVPANE